MNNNQKGFTLLELILSMGLLGIVVLIVFSFLISNINNFERNEVDITLQQNARSATEFITKEVIRAKSVIEVKNKNGAIVTDEYLKLTGTNSIEIKSIVFSILEEEKNSNIYDRIMFELPSNDEFDKLKYGYIKKNGSKYTNMEVAFYIDKMIVRPILDKDSNQKGIKFTLFPKKDDHSIKPVETNIYFRNVQ